MPCEPVNQRRQLSSTYIVQFRHDSSAAAHFKLEEVVYLLWVAKGFEDVHVYIVSDLRSSVGCWRRSGVQEYRRWRSSLTCIALIQAVDVGDIQPLRYTILSVTQIVRSTHLSDWPVCHGLRAKWPMIEWSRWCDAPPRDEWAVLMVEALSDWPNGKQIRSAGGRICQFLVCCGRGERGETQRAQA